MGREGVEGRIGRETQGCSGKDRKVGEEEGWKGEDAKLEEEERGG